MDNIANGIWAMLTTPVITKDCDCSFTDMQPVTIDNTAKRCGVCSGSITEDQQTGYDRFHELSGFDEVEDRE